MIAGVDGQDTLAGGGGNDTFVLSNEGFAFIEDFTIGQDIIELSSGEYSIESDDDSNVAELFFGDDDGDLIARIQFSGLGSGFGDDDEFNISSGETVGGIFRGV